MLSSRDEPLTAVDVVRCVYLARMAAKRGDRKAARRWQAKRNAGQWNRGKSFDTFCPLGPELVTADELQDPQNLNLTCVLNGQVMQDANGELCFNELREPDPDDLQHIEIIEKEIEAHDLQNKIEIE